MVARHAEPLSIRNNRFRRDVRSLEEEEEVWFEQDADLEDVAVTPVPVSDSVLKHKLDADLDTIQKNWEHRKGTFLIFNITPVL